MIAKKTSMKVVEKSSIKGLVKYMTSSQNKTERVGEITITNCNSNNLEWATLEIETVQKMNTRSKADKTYHLLISFPDGETPPQDILKDVEKEICNGLGYSEHQRISVVHRDTDNLHLHVAVNKIHPEKFTILEPKSDFKILGKKCEELEKKNNLKKTNHRSKRNRAERLAADIESHSGEKTFLSWMIEEHSESLLECSSWKELSDYLDNIGVEILPRGNGLVFRDTFNDIAVKASSVDRLLSKPKLEERLSGAALSQDTKSNNLEIFVKNPKSIKNLSTLTSWQDFKRTLKKSGLELRLRGNGFIIADIATGDSVKASSIDRSFSKSKLELKFGPFKKAEQTKKKGSFTKGLKSKNQQPALYEEYLAAKKSANEFKSGEFLRIDQDRSRAIGTAKRKAKTKRAAIKLMKVSGIQRKLLYATVTKKLKRDIDKALRKSREKKSNILYVNRGRSWYNWLQQEAMNGNTTAIEALRKRRVVTAKGNRVDGVEKRRNNLLDVKHINNVTKNGTVVYMLNSCVIRDYGTSLKITSGAGDLAIKQLLKSSVKKFGNKLDINGSDDFKEQVLRVAVKEKISVRFGDKKMETKRLKVLNKGRGGRK